MHDVVMTVLPVEPDFLTTLHGVLLFRRLLLVTQESARVAIRTRSIRSLDFARDGIIRSVRQAEHPLSKGEPRAFLEARSSYHEVVETSIVVIYYLYEC